MARIRSVHPGFFSDENLVQCSPMARLLFIGIWTQADDQGVFEWKPLTLKMRLFPADNADVAALMSELASAKTIFQFEHDGRTFGAIRNFRKYQRPKKPLDVHFLPEELRHYVALDNADESERRTLVREQEGRCYYCACAISHYAKRSDSADVDHIVPRSKGGGDEIANKCAACRYCNRAKGDLSAREYLLSDGFRKKIGDLALSVGAISDFRTRVAEIRSRKGVASEQREDGGEKKDSRAVGKTGSTSGIPVEAGVSVSGKAPSARRRA